MATTIGQLDNSSDLDRREKTRSKHFVLYAKTLLAETHLRVGRIRGGLPLIEVIEFAQEQSSVRFHQEIRARVARHLRLATDATNRGAGLQAAAPLRHRITSC